MKRAVILALALAASTAGARADLADLFPDGTAYVVRLHMTALVGQPVVGDAKAIKAALGDAAKVLESCGIDPVRDLTQATLAVGASASARTAVVLVEGAFDPARVNARIAQMAADKKSGIEPRANGVTQWTLPPDKAPSAGGVTLPRRFFFAVLDDKLAAWAIDEAAVNDAIDKKAGRKRGETAKAVRELLAKVNPKLAVAVVAVPPPGVLGRSPAAGLTHVTGGLLATDALKLDLTCATKDANAARALAEYIGDGMATIKSFAVLAAAQSKTVSAGQQAMIREFFDTFAATPTPTGVAVTSVLSKDFLDKNAKK